LVAALVPATAVALLVVAVAVSAPGDPKRALKPADQTRAKSLVLRQTELPAGQWKVSRTDFSQANPQCVLRNYRLDSLTETGLVGFDYSDPGAGTSIESDASVFVSSSQARRAFATYSQPGFYGCVASAFTSVPGITVKIIRKERASPFGSAANGIDASAFHMTLSIHSSKGTLLLDLIFVEMHSGRGLAQLVFSQAGGAVSTRLAFEVIDRVALKVRQF
jgi:hypothetical protein